MTRTLISRPAVRVAGTEHERCDRCGVEAKMIARLSTGGVLAFCGHHANRYADRISEMASVVIIEPHFPWKGTEETVR